MAFSIKNDEADQLLRELVGITGESLTAAVTESLRERLVRERLGHQDKRRAIQRALQRCRSLPVLDHVTAEDVLQWDADGLPL